MDDLDWFDAPPGISSSEPDEPAPDHPSLPLGIAIGCVIAGLLAGLTSFLPLHVLGYMLAAFVGLSMLTTYWKQDNERRRHMYYRPQPALGILAKVIAVAAVGATALNVWHIAYGIATR